MQKAKLPTLHTRRLQAIATVLYKVKNNLAPPYIADLFEVNNSQYHLRNSEFVVPRFRTVAFGKHSISYLGPVIWSKLSQYIRSSESVDIFKKRIKSVELSNLMCNTSGAPNDGFLPNTLKRCFRLSGGPLKLCRLSLGCAIKCLSVRSF